MWAGIEIQSRRWLREIRCGFGFRAYGLEFCRFSVEGLGGLTNPQCCSVCFKTNANFLLGPQTPSKASRPGK